MSDHGTSGRYDQGCRCDPCRRANTVVVGKRRRERAKAVAELRDAYLALDYGREKWLALDAAIRKVIERRNRSGDVWPRDVKKSTLWSALGDDTSLMDDQ